MYFIVFLVVEIFYCRSGLFVCGDFFEIEPDQSSRCFAVQNLKEERQILVNRPVHKRCRTLIMFLKTHYQGIIVLISHEQKGTLTPLHIH